MTGIRWAPKVRPERLRRLYECDAAGRLDDDLLTDVGWALLARCESIIRVTRRQVRCPVCADIVDVGASAEDPDAVSACKTCGWTTSFRTWHASWRHRDLHGRNALPAFERFVAEFPGAPSSAAKMLAIDRLVHAVHHDLRFADPHRAAAHNLIEGNHRQALAFLDALAGDTTTPGRRSVREGWQANRARMRRG
jgi:hypothetical protein